MKISVIAPVLNEVQFIGYSVMACLEQMHEFIYALDENTSDGTYELLHHLKRKYAHEKLTIINFPTYHPANQKAYNASFNACIERSTGEAVMFLHPDQIIINPEVIPEIPFRAMAYFTHMTSYARDFKTVITKGRCTQWKNIHSRKMGLHYSGGYGSPNEDFYHLDITGRSTKHFGTEFSKYPYSVMDSGIKINHYCECKDYARRLEKMKHCLRTLYPDFAEERLEELARQHPRVTLENSSKLFGEFEFKESKDPVPEVFAKYKEEFEAFRKELIYG